MNDRIKELMLEAGYATPELAIRANKLVQLLVTDCVSICLDNVVGQVGTSAAIHNRAIAKCADSIIEKYTND